MWGLIKDLLRQSLDESPYGLSEGYANGLGNKHFQSISPAQSITMRLSHLLNTRARLSS